MTLRRIQVSDFRCLHSAELEFDPKFTLISGPNASGKTSLLESIYVLGRGRSFRTRRLDNLIRLGADRFVIYGEAGAERRTGLGIEGSALGMRAKMGGDRVASLAELAAVLPVQIIDPEVHRLIEEGPSRRRRFLDWGVFHVEHSFVEKWQQYQQVLKQRNAALKARQPAAAVSAWDVDLVKLGVSIHEARALYVDQLAPVASDIAKRLLGLQLSMSYRPGWSRDLSLAEALKASWVHDQDAGVTQIGPQRAEIAFRLDGAPVKDRISRGQQKLLASSLLMAQLSLFPDDPSARPTLLLDDPAAELDSDRLLGLIREVAAQSVQLVVTSLSTDFSAFGMPGRRYTISAGVVEQVG
ncbi:MAG: replication and repair protein RecF [Gammaproteobacteria bacterium]|jgi:DNA replication and repair protein RecF|nr:replication and repair protein RecF [Gammaproteobacteria bacterium]